MEAETARSRFRLEEGVREERFVRRRVSGERPTLKDVGGLGGWFSEEEGEGRRAVMVRQVPMWVGGVSEWRGGGCFGREKE